jgi:hypothetical protein
MIRSLFIYVISVRSSNVLNDISDLAGPFHDPLFDKCDPYSPQIRCDLVPKEFINCDPIKTVKNEEITNGTSSIDTEEEDNFTSKYGVRSLIGNKS